MRGLRRAFFAVAVIAAIWLPSPAAAGEALQLATSSDQSAAEAVLGPHWKQLSRRAGMIFSGTVLSTPASARTRTDYAVPAVELSFQVDRAIAGVKAGQILTIHEWAGALSNLRPLRRGDRVLLLLYPPSRLGLTSPVGGSQGQIRLDGTGQNIVDSKAAVPALKAKPGSMGNNQAPMSTVSAHGLAGVRSITLTQLERAIRAARGE